MSERKVLQKYYPPDFDPSAVTRVKGEKSKGPRTQLIRLMAPFSMKCTSCAEYIYKGRKFNARKETSTEKYLNIPIYRFYIKCTRCSAEITFKTDPKNMDYTCESGAKRNFEPWRNADAKIETDEERLDRLEREEAEVDAMDQLETKMFDAKREMAIHDALDEIQSRNARNAGIAEGGAATIVAGPSAKSEAELERERQEKEDEEAARKAFAKKPLIELSDEEGAEEETIEADAIAMPPPLPPSQPITEAVKTNLTPAPSKQGVKRKKDFSAALGIKKKKPLV